MLRFGVLGAGRIGKVHARTIAASGKARVAYLADAMPKAAEDLAAEVEASVASVEDIIKASDVDAILIATPTPFHAEQIEAVDAVLGELDAKGKQTIMVFNKCDLVTDPEIVQANLARHPGSVAVSARTGEGMAQLIKELEIRLAAWRMQGRFEIPLTEQALLAEIHRVGHVLDLKYGEASAMITAHIPPELIGRLSKYDAGSPQK